MLQPAAAAFRKHANAKPLAGANGQRPRGGQRDAISGRLLNVRLDASSAAIKAKQSARFEPRTIFDVSKSLISSTSILVSSQREWANKF